MNAQDLKNSILQRAIEGKLVPQRKEEGTAKELLAEIRAEKARLIKEKKIKKSKPLPAITDDEKPFDIPDSWEWVRLNEVIDVRDGTHDTPPYYPTGIPLITSKNLSNGKLDFTNVKYISKQAADNINKRSRVDIGDILFAMIGSIGNPVIVNDNREFCIKNIALFKQISPKLINIKYIYFILVFLQSRLKGIASGGVQSFISLRVFRRYIIPIPPIAEQQRIVAKIEELQPDIDAYDKAQTKLQAIEQRFPDDMKKSLLQYAIEGKLVPQRKEEGTAKELLAEIRAEKVRLVKEKKIKKSKPLPAITDDEKPFDIPDSWQWVRLSDIAALSDNAFADGPFGSNLKREHYTEQPEVRIIQLSNIGDFQWKDKNKKYTTFKHAQTISRSIVEAGSIVIAKMMPAGRAIEVPNQEQAYILSSDAVKFAPYPTIYKPYLLYAINSPMFKKQINEEVHGVTRVRTSLTKLKKYLIPLPPIAEQRRIVAKLEEFLPLCQQLANHP